MATFKILQRQKYWLFGFLSLLLSAVFLMSLSSESTSYVILDYVTILRPATFSLMNSFNSDWCRVRRAAMDWRQAIKPCGRNMSWESKVYDMSMRTNGNASSVINWALKPAGNFSRFFIQSRTASGVEKTVGGDSWLVRIKGTANISPTVIDHDNGFYEVLFLIMESGDYQAEIRLDYTLCDGYRDPPTDWFIIGNSQGKHQPEGTLGKLDDYLLEPLAGEKLHKFTIKPSHNPYELLNGLDTPHTVSGCGSRICRFLWDGHGRWVDRTWRPFVPDSLQEPRNRNLFLGKGTLWSYGDSVNYNRYRYNFNKSTLCSRMFDRCQFNINFVYHIKYRRQVDMTETDDLGFDVNRVLNHFRSVIFDPRVNHVNTVIALNMGLHYVMSLTLEQYQDLIKKTIAVIKQTEWGPHGREIRKFKGHVIWFTTTAINKEKAKELQATKWRFCTYQRVILFNSYATSAMCEAGIDIMDMYPMTDSYTDGTYDVVHYRPPASQPLVSVLEDYLDGPLE